MKHDDAHSERKWKLEQTAIDGGTTPRWPAIMNTETKPEETENPHESLRLALCDAMFGGGLYFPLDANLIQQARERLLTSRELRCLFMDELTKLTLKEMPRSAWFAYELVNATPEQQARAILAAIKP